MTRLPRPPAPEPLPLPVVDDHTHLDHVRAQDGGQDAAPPPDDVVAGLIEAAAAVNVPRMVQIGSDLPAARWTVDAVQRHPALVGGVALHPTEAARLAGESPQALRAALAEIERLAGRPRIRVVGETGLDHYWVTDPVGRASQEESFRWHIRLAKELEAVLQIHDRDAHGDVLRILQDEGAPARTVFHCFSGDADMARHCAERGWFLSFAGTLTFKNAEPLREALRAVPFEQVMVESDAPYLAPMPYRGRPNASYLVPHTVRCMAEVTGRRLEDVCAHLGHTAENMYGSW